MPKPRRGGGNGGLSWIKKSEPKFIREFKERIAYKEQANIETKKKKDTDIIIEKEEDKPQIVQLKSGDLGEKEYTELKSKEEVENAASSFGKILFKKPKKKSEISNELTSQNLEKELVDSKKSNEIDLIFNLNEEGIEKEQPNLESESNKDPLKKKYLEDEEQQSKIYGLQEPPVKKRFIDKPNNKVTTLSASKVLAREAKAGNKKLLSFYDEEEEEKEEYIRDDLDERQKLDASFDSD